MKKVTVCGKGGCGKSVVTTLLTRVLAEEGYTVLTLDTDESNPGLYRMLGFDHSGTALVEEFRGGAHIMREFELEKISLEDISSEYFVQEGKIKLMVAGKINVAFQGCACTLGSIVKHFLGKLDLRENEIVVVDTEAGVEHFGRGLEKNVDVVLVVVEPYFESVVVAEKISSLAEQIGTCKLWAIINKISTEEEEQGVREKLEDRGIKIVGSVHHDSQIANACLYGKAIGNSQAKEEVRKIVLSLLKKNNSDNSTEKYG
jgi:CO dehydrogenase maturation factor